MSGIKVERSELASFFKHVDATPLGWTSDQDVWDSLFALTAFANRHDLWEEVQSPSTELGIILHSMVRHIASIGRCVDQLVWMFKKFAKHHFPPGRHAFDPTPVAQLWADHLRSIADEIDRISKQTSEIRRMSEELAAKRAALNAEADQADKPRKDEDADDAAERAADADWKKLLQAREFLETAEKKLGTYTRVVEMANDELVKTRAVVARLTDYKDRGVLTEGWGEGQGALDQAIKKVDELVAEASEYNSKMRMWGGTVVGARVQVWRFEEREAQHRAARVAAVNLRELVEIFGNLNSPKRQKIDETSNYDTQRLLAPMFTDQMQKEIATINPDDDVVELFENVSGVATRESEFRVRVIKDLIKAARIWTTPVDATSPEYAKMLSAKMTGQ